MKSEEEKENKTMKQKEKIRKQLGSDGSETAPDPALISEGKSNFSVLSLWCSC
jgi:hypothetical protein